MSSGGHSPPSSHQHHGDSHDRIFGGFTMTEDAEGGAAPTAPAAPARQLSGQRASATAAAASSGRRRRWVRTRTQHLSTLSLQAEADAASAGDHAATESALYGGTHCRSAAAAAVPPPLLPLPSDGEDAAIAAAAAPVGVPPCGRYAYRRPDGNPVTGEGYSRLGSCDLQVTTKK